MPKRNHDYMDAQRRKILAAAKRVAIKKGLAHMSMRDIAEEAGMSLGAITLHFPKRADIVGFAAQEAAGLLHELDGLLDYPERHAENLSGSRASEDFVLDIDVIAEARCSDELRDIARGANQRLLEGLARALVKRGVPGEYSLERAKIMLALHYGLTALGALGMDFDSVQAGRVIRQWSGDRKPG